MLDSLNPHCVYSCDLGGTGRVVGPGKGIIEGPFSEVDSVRGVDDRWVAGGNVEDWDRGGTGSGGVNFALAGFGAGRAGRWPTGRGRGFG